MNECMNVCANMCEYMYMGEYFIFDLIIPANTNIKTNQIIPSNSI